MFSLICERRCMSDWILKLLLMSWDVLQWASAQIQGLTTELLCIIWLKIDFHIISRWTLDWSSSSALLDYPHIIFVLEKCLKSDYQDLLRSVCFQKIYFHCSSVEEWSSQAFETSHIFWGMFLSFNIVLCSGTSCTRYFWGVMWHTAAPIALKFLRLIYFFLLIQNIPKCINYIMKYLDSHFYRLC